ncbi:MAG TPA: carboxypeptidase-like regulatory domain-containing protein [Bryobacteraceae bacterium]|nr:carboxypeptidase-like regulatory domain-containing protein [Bryobacteraceae bacterium]
MLRLLTVALALAGAALAAQTVQGRVVDAASGAPLADVNVILGAIDRPGGGPYRATTDRSGNFEMQGVAEGTYIATYRARGYWSTYEPGDSRQPHYTVGASGAPPRLEAKLQPIPKLSGRVLDDEGNPVASASVRLFYQNGHCSLPSCFIRGRDLTTDSNGKFTTADFFSPGRWLAAAIAPQTFKAPPDRDQQKLTWMETFYPSAVDAQFASPVDVRAGLELPLVEIRLRAAPAFRLRGRVLDEKGNPAARAALALHNGLGAEMTANAGNDGSFEFAGVGPGEWRLSGTLLKDKIPLWVAQSMEVKDHDLADVRVRLTSPMRIHGHSVLEGPDGDRLPDQEPAGVVLNYDSGEWGQESIMPSRPIGLGDENGGFSLSLYPGRYHVSILEPPPPGYYVSAIVMGDRNALTPEGIEISSAAQELVIRYRSGGGTVRGKVENCGNSDVFLVPREAALRQPQFIRHAGCEAGGRFELGLVRPGQYFAFATSGDTGFLQMPDDDTLSRLATLVTVRDREPVTADVRIMQ